MQDLQRIFHDMPMDVYQQSNEVSSYSIQAHQEALFNDLASQQGRRYYVEPDMVASSHHRVTWDHRNEAFTTRTDKPALPDKQPTRSLSESGKEQPMIMIPEHTSSGSRTLSDNGKGLQARVNSTSKPATITSQDLASTLASEIADRLGFSSNKESQYKTKEDVERAIQNSVIDLLSSNASQKKITQESPTGDAAETERLFKCDFCSKRKKSQCDLT